MAPQTTPRPRVAAVSPLRRADAGPPRVQHEEPGQRLRIDGRVDAASVAEVRQGLRDALDHGVGELVVDVARLELGDATGLGMLLGAHRHALRTGRSLVLANVPETLARVLAATRLARVLTARAESALPA